MHILLPYDGTGPPRLKRWALASRIEKPGPGQPDARTPVDALKYAVELLAKGYADVVIVDLTENGKAYAPAEFREFYLARENNTGRYDAGRIAANIAKLPELPPAS